jgi:biotin transport system substrate-specific component
MSTYADILRPAARQPARAYDIAAILSGMLLITLSAQVAVYLPFSPVPVTGQTLAVLLIGALLGSRRGALCLIGYLVEGAAGLPVFANGHAGAAYLTGPTGGYLIGFVVAAYLTGWLAERGWDRQPRTALLVMLIGNAAIYTFGLIGLIRFVGSGQVFDAGLIPFLPGDLTKLALATALLPSGWRIMAWAGLRVPPGQ